MKVDVVVYPDGKRTVIGQVDVYASSWTVGDTESRWELDLAVLQDEMELVLHKKEVTDGGDARPEGQETSPGS